jgi:hypothetical protein
MEWYGREILDSVSCIMERAATVMNGQLDGDLIHECHDELNSHRDSFSSVFERIREKMEVEKENA